MRSGAEGEKRAAQFLSDDGYLIVALNFRSQWGEIDIIASRGDELVFAEVKTWRHAPAESLEVAMGTWKQERIVRTAEYFLYRRPQWNGRRLRFDLLLVSADLRSVEHLRDAF